MGELLVGYAGGAVSALLAFLIWRGLRKEGRHRKVDQLGKELREVQGSAASREQEAATFTGGGTTETTFDIFEHPPDQPTFPGHSPYCNWIHSPPGKDCDCTPRCGTTKAAPGWTCTRSEGHEGPCAAVRISENRLTTREMKAIILPPDAPEPTARRMTPLAWLRSRRKGSP